jgi:hypothetical protein
MGSISSLAPVGSEACCDGYSYVVAPKKLTRAGKFQDNLAGELERRLRPDLPRDRRAERRPLDERLELCEPPVLTHVRRRPS